MLTMNVERAGCNTASLPFSCSSIPDQINKWMIIQSTCDKHTDTSIVFLSVHSIFLVSILTLKLYSYLYIQHSLSAYWHYHCIPTCTFNIPCKHTDTKIVFLPVHSIFLVSILTLSYAYNECGTCWLQYSVYPFSLFKYSWSDQQVNDNTEYMWYQ
jgi:hypothetical protein